MNKAWSVVLSIIITIAVAGGGMYYYLNTKAKTEKAELQSQIDELREDKDRLESEVGSLQNNEKDVLLSERTQNTETDGVTTADWKKYTNSDYGFSLTFNDNWKDYELISKDAGSGALDTLYVCIPTNSTAWNDIKKGVFCPMAISVVKISQWANYQSSNDPVTPVEIARNSSYIFTKSSAQDSPEDGFDAMNDIKNIIESFSAFDI